jgi:DnaJ-class molecular chaperone
MTTKYTFEKGFYPNQVDLDPEQLFIPELKSDAEAVAYALKIKADHAYRYDEIRPVTVFRRCKECDGTGEVHSHNPRCWDCGGTGNSEYKFVRDQSSVAK